MPKLKLVIALMTFAAAVIIGMAVYLFLNFSTISVASSIVLIVVALLLLFFVMGILLAMVKGYNRK